MPVHDAGREITGFSPDILPEVTDGLALKQEALAVLTGAPVALPGLAGEIFQNYDSLPDALRPTFGSIVKQRHPSAGNF